MTPEQLAGINRREATAYHEAGHAVIGRVFGLSCGSATIVPCVADDEARHAIIHDPWKTVSDWDAEIFHLVEQGLQPLKYRDARSAFRGGIIARMAGAEAENELLGRCGCGDGYDRYEIELMASSRYSELPDDLWARYEPRMRRQARRLVRKH